MSNDKIIQLTDAKARAAGVHPELAQVIEQINQRYQLRIDLTDQRLTGFKALFPALNQAAQQQHQLHLDQAPPAVEYAFRQGWEAGKAQMMMDVIICILESDGVIKREQ